MAKEFEWHKAGHDRRLKEIGSRIWFGTQYYRPPQPLPRFWESDFNLMKKAGLEVARAWIYWRWHEREPGRFQFEELDRLFELGRRHGVFIHPLLFLESAPEWFIRQFPETWFVDHQGVSYYPLNRKSTQIGGMAVCGNHPLTKEWSGRFLTALVNRYREHPALLCWDVWNELQTKSVEGICACHHCRADYRSHLQQRYASLGELNAALNTGYGTWEDVLPPNGNNDYAAWFAWRRWEASSLSRQALWRARTIWAADPRQVVMIHMPTKLSVPGHGCGDWNDCAPYLDFAGNSSHIQRSHRGYSLPERLSARNLLAAEHDIAVQQSPNFAWAGEVSSDTASYDAPPPLHPDELAYWTWKPISLGMRGVFYWQFRPEAYGPESPDLGLLELDGRASNRWERVGEIVKLVRENEPLFRSARPPVPQVGILTCPEQHMACATLYSKNSGGQQLFQKSVLNLYDVFRSAGIPAAFVDPDRIGSAIKLLLVPRSPAGRPELKAGLLKFLEGGGTAVVEGGFMSADGASFILEETAPGLGLDRVFGLREGRPESTRWHGLPTGSEESRLSKQELDDAWLDAGVDRETERSREKLAPELRISLAWGGREYPVTAGFDRRPLRAAGAEIIGRFASGEAAAATRRVGKGRLIYVGTAASYVDRIFGGGYGRFLRALAGELAIRPPLPIPPAAGATWRVLEAGARRLLFCFNHLETPVGFDLSRCGPARLIYGPGVELKGGRLSVGPLATAVLELKNPTKEKSR